ncbi:MAG: peptidoglycan-associated lipoprotein Pal [Pseudomonadales bacterium]
MQLANIFKVSLLGLILATAAGCSSTGGGSDAAGSAGVDSSEAGYGAGDRAALEAEERAAADAARAAAEAEQLLNITTFYFDFDQSTLKQEARAALEAHAAYLVQSGSNVVLEGHGDERGTREYNLALGERRAQAVARYLTVLGVSSQQIESVSYGEERAASMGHDDSSWSLNRRVELRYGR